MHVSSSTNIWKKIYIFPWGFKNIFKNTFIYVWMSVLVTTFIFFFTDFQVWHHVGIPKSSRARLIRAYVKSLVSELGIPVVFSTQWPGLVKRVTIIVLRRTRKSSELGVGFIPKTVKLLRTTHRPIMIWLRNPSHPWVVSPITEKLKMILFLLKDAAWGQLKEWSPLER